MKLADSVLKGPGNWKMGWNAIHFSQISNKKEKIEKWIRNQEVSIVTRRGLDFGIGWQDTTVFLVKQSIFNLSKYHFDDMSPW